ncbi:Transcriptional regulatory protein LevR, contains PRD, AAA+ and EIIA domains [Anaerovirgula multivorans]|uniref:Transcriptional regulatory protein LevR, contains PRD, AAA+ and EIIA domains n=1 Tax=Anaerovirgula multivorans TaxID=312168 RepID=A0A239IRZ8_9FIRM|nr:sigma-54-dependent transcriptional regulator [Anaerovirgula multivorans]SNS95988.1 Transcriptional regulatory protein LevR, contains PRD, AAA+ and EIIA domains [Anaerovirgula multivorans]
MKRIDIVYDKLKEMDTGDRVSASILAEVLGLSRANVSSDLNRLCQEGMVIKDDRTRPVLFSPAEKNSPNKEGTILDRFSQKNSSLYSAIEQAKAAVLYPPNGMHMLILGETGVGKSMFAELIHRYAVEMNKMNENSPFIVFNCADYANNPQLLISQLFGHRKGAYTGADYDKAGLIEKADGGILFLDEVHRLPPEGQEMFFTFMDRSTFRRLGETELERKAKVLIISATTENPESTLLKTFTRRIPMVLRISNLQERSFDERFHLIGIFFREEASRLGKPIEVSVNSMRALLNYECKNNVGQLKTDIQLACAKAYADYVSNNKENIRIRSMDLPSYIRDGLYKMEIEDRQLWNKLIGINTKYCIFDKSEENMLLELDNDEKSIYEIIDMDIHELRARGFSSSAIEGELEKSIEEYYTKYIYRINRNSDISNLKNIVGKDIIKVVEEVLDYSEKSLNRPLSKKVLYGMTVHIAHALDRIKRNKKIVNPQLNKIRVAYKKEFNTAVDCLKIMERIFEITLPIDEAGFLAMFFVYDDTHTTKDINDVQVIVIAHGNNTATSMVEAANNLLGENHAIGINAPLDENPKSVLARLIAYLRESDITSDVLLLVDMGSLTTFGEEVEKELGIQTKTISLVSTLHVIEATRKAMLGYSLEEIYTDLLHIDNFFGDPAGKAKMDERFDTKLVIITLCTTGEGSATAIKELLERQLEFDKNLLDIIPINLVGRENINLRLKNIDRFNRIIFIVTPFTIETTAPLFGIEEVFSQEATLEMQKIIDIETTYFKIADTLKNLLIHISAEKSIKDIKKFTKAIENKLNIKIDTKALIGITLHIACMLDRLKGGGEIQPFKERDQYISQHPQLYKVVKNASADIMNKYDIVISDDEICNIMLFFNPSNFID